MFVNDALGYVGLLVLGVALYFTLFFLLEILAGKSLFWKNLKKTLEEDASFLGWKSSFIILCFGCSLGLFIVGFDFFTTDNFSLNRGYTIFAVTIIIVFISMH